MFNKLKAVAGYAHFYWGVTPRMHARIEKAVSGGENDRLWLRAMVHNSDFSPLKKQAAIDIFRRNPDVVQGLLEEFLEESKGRGGMFGQAFFSEFTKFIHTEMPEIFEKGQLDNNVFKAFIEETPAHFAWVDVAKDLKDTPFGGVLKEALKNRVLQEAMSNKYGVEVVLPSLSKFEPVFTLKVARQCAAKWTFGAEDAKWDDFLRFMGYAQQANVPLSAYLPLDATIVDIAGRIAAAAKEDLECVRAFKDFIHFLPLDKLRLVPASVTTSVLLSLNDHMQSGGKDATCSYLQKEFATVVARHPDATVREGASYALAPERMPVQRLN